MSLLREKLAASPIHARVVPYVLILLLTFTQDGLFKAEGRYWMYLVKMLVGLWCILEMRSLVPELRWAVSWEAVAVGILVFVIWVGLDPWYAKISFLVSNGPPWNPLEQFGKSAEGWFFVVVRTFGSAIIVPPIEESFYRSFLYRYFVRQKFTELPLNRLHWLSLVVTSAVFGFVHYQWLAGILCGLCFQWLVIRKNRLGDAMTAHAITNFLLGVYIPWQGGSAWHFW
jgi:CAAX prenyl protease-like protein